MRAHYLQHVPFEGLGSIAAWLQATGATVTATHCYEQPRFPQVQDFDLLIVMGGPMSVNDEATLPWLAAEKQLVREAIAQGKAVVGICLGAQLIASALGAAVYPNTEQEIGWWPVSRAPGADAPGLFRFPDSLPVFHWHGETFDLPPGAVHLAQSAGCANQAFQIGRRVIGLQFHLETTPHSAADIVAHCRSELRPAPYVQSEAQILGAYAGTYAGINALMAQVLAFVSAG